MLKGLGDMFKWTIKELRVTLLLVGLLILNGLVIYLSRGNMEVLQTMGPFLLQMDVGMSIAISSRALLPALEIIGQIKGVKKPQTNGG